MPSEESPGMLGMPDRCACKARAFCMRSDGRLVALTGSRRALLSVPLTVEVGCINAEFWGSETVRNEGTRRGVSPQRGEEELGEPS